MRRLTVSLDAAAALREEGGSGAADLAAAAMLAELAGAGGVRLSVNEEGRPVGESELREVARAARGFELRMPPIPMLVKTALESRPQRVVLAAAPRDGRHAAPLDFQAWGSALPPFVRTLEEAGIGVGVLVTPQPQAVKAAHGAGLRAVEFHTGAVVDLPPRERSEALAGLGDASRLAAKLGMAVAVGGSLDHASLGPVLDAVPVATTVVVGRAWVGRSLLVGIDRATRDLREQVG
jgi:pyridoxine 5-phosphate synthase